LIASLDLISSMCFWNQDWRSYYRNNGILEECRANMLMEMHLTRNPLNFVALIFQWQICTWLEVC